jgi:hypothetical protein
MPESQSLGLFLEGLQDMVRHLLTLRSKITLQGNNLTINKFPDGPFDELDLFR